MHVRLGDLNVVSEHVVEAYLQRLNAGTLAFAHFNGGDVALAVLADVAQFVKLGIHAGANGSAVGDGYWRLVGDAFQNTRADFGKLVKARFAK